MKAQPRSERYEIVRQLGEGGMGVVYLAVDRERDAPVALKTIRKANPDVMARFKREFRALTGVVHPNLVALYELVADCDQVFFTMELVSGAPFHHWVRERTCEPGRATETTDASLAAPTNPTLSVGPVRHSVDPGVLDIRRLRAALRQLAEGVAAIHAAGKLHRDLKPSNVLITDDGRVVILDFGLVTDLADERAATDEDRPLEGTVSFMSPEQGARQSLTPASDWYSVGVMLYLALTGRLPFVGGRDDVLMDKQRFAPPPPEELVGDLPPDLCALCTELLRREPERRPSGAEVLRRVGSQATAVVAGSTLGTQPTGEPLIGRERELAELRATLDATATGTAGVAQVFGPSGIGKSTIVRAFLDEARADCLVLQGRCYEHEVVPFKAVDSLIDALAGYLAKLPPLDVEGLMPRDALALARTFPVLRQVTAFTSTRRRAIEQTDPQELRRRVFGALRDLLSRLADRQPLVLALDDLQWGDVDSASLLATVLRPPDAPQVLLVCTFRSEDVGSSAFLSAFDRHVHELGVRVSRVSVDTLGPEEARELAAAHLAGHPEAETHAAWIAAESGGSPLFVEELARHVRSEGTGSRDWASLNDALRARISRLPDDAGCMLATIAAAGRPIERAVAIRASGIDDPAVLSLLKAGSFIRTRYIGDRRFLECYHDRIRENAIELLDDQVRIDRHLALAHALEAAAQPDPEALAIHYHAAGERVRAGELAVEAARRAAHALAFDRAAKLYGMALEVAPGDRALRIALAEALANGGRGELAADAYLAAVEGATSEAEILDLRCRASWQLLASGHIDRGIAELEEVLRGVRLVYPATPRRALASIVWGRLRLALRGLRFAELDEREVPASRLAQIDALFAAAQLLGMAEVVRSADFHVKSLRLALDTGEPKRVARALAGEAVFVSLAGVSTARRADAILDTLRQLSERLGDPGTRGLTAGSEAMTAFNLGRFCASLDSALESERIFRDECTGFHWEIATAQLFQGFCLALTGRVSDMVRRFPVLVKEANERGNLYAATSFRACLGFYVPLTADDPDRALAEVDDAIGRWSAIGYHLQHANALSSRLCIDIYSRNGRRGLQRCDQEWPALSRSLLLRTQIMRALLWSGRARCALAAHEEGAGDEVLRVVARVAAMMDRERAPYCVAQAELLRAGLAWRRGDRDGAVATLRRGIELADRAEIHMNAMCASRALGVVLGGDEGGELVRKADEFFTGQGLVNPAAIGRIFAPGFDQ